LGGSRSRSSYSSGGSSAPASIGRRTVATPRISVQTSPWYDAGCDADGLAAWAIVGRACPTAVKARGQPDYTTARDPPPGASNPASEAVKRLGGVSDSRAARAGRGRAPVPARQAEGADRPGRFALARERVRLAWAPDRRALGRCAATHRNEGRQRLRVQAAQDVKP